MPNGGAPIVNAPTAGDSLGGSIRCVFSTATRVATDFAVVGSPILTPVVDASDSRRLAKVPGSYQIQFKLHQATAGSAAWGNPVSVTVVKDHITVVSVPYH